MNLTIKAAFGGIIFVLFLFHIEINSSLTSFLLSNINKNCQVNMAKEDPIDPLESMKLRTNGLNNSNSARFGCSRIWPANQLEGKFEGKPKPHRGLDLEASINTPIKSIYSGILIIPEKQTGDFGINIIVKSEQNNVAIRYLHLNEITAGLKDGDKTKQGDIIGKTGNTGEAKDFPHLHIEVSPTLNFDDNCRLDREDPENHIKTKFNSKNENLPLCKCNTHLCPDQSC